MLLKPTLHSITKPMQKIMLKLDTFIDTQNKERLNNISKIDNLSLRNTEIEKDTLHAYTIRENINKLLGN